MRKSHKILGAVAIAGLIAAGGSAFTAGNTFDDPTDVLGTGAVSVTGVEVDEVHYVTSANTITGVTFDLATDLTDPASAHLRLLDGPGGALVTNGAVTCDVDETLDVITCTLAPAVVTGDVESTELTVVDDDA